MEEESDVLQIAKEASSYRAKEQWAEASRCYERLLQKSLSSEDRAKTYANLMQMYEKQGRIEEAASAALSAFQIIQDAGLARTNEGAHMRGLVRGFLMKLRDDHLGTGKLNDLEIVASLLSTIEPKKAFVQTYLTNDPVFGLWCFLFVAGVASLSLYYVLPRLIKVRTEHPKLAAWAIVAFALFVFFVIARYVGTWLIVTKGSNDPNVIELLLLVLNLFLVPLSTILAVGTFYTITVLFSKTG